MRHEQAMERLRVLMGLDRETNDWFFEDLATDSVEALVKRLAEAEERVEKAEELRDLYQGELGKAKLELNEMAADCTSWMERAERAEAKWDEWMFACDKEHDERLKERLFLEAENARLRTECNDQAQHIGESDNEVVRLRERVHSLEEKVLLLLEEIKVRKGLQDPDRKSGVIPMSNKGQRARDAEEKDHE